jgi:hypothetical protein
MWENVPWMVGGNVEHSVDVARLLAYAAFNGDEGIIGPRDLEVREMPVPGTQVRVYPGACAILNRAAGAKYEAYAARLPSEDVVDIAPTGSGGGRTDLIVARIENPHENGEPWPEPGAGEENTYQYVRTAVISGVPDNTKTVKGLGLGYSAIPLARITLPASTGTVQQSRITDLRQMTQVRRSETMHVVAPTTERRLTSTDWVNWPPDLNMDLEVPEWATHLQVQGILGGVRFGAAGTNGGAGWNTFGSLRVQLGLEAAGAVYSQATAYNISNESGQDRTTLIVGAPAIKIPAAMRGAPSSIRIEGNRNSGSSTSLFVDQSSMCSLEVKFLQAPESNL